MRFVKHRHNEPDKFFTPPATVQKCLSHINPTDYALVIDPSAGAGAFHDAIPHPNKLALDIAPDAPHISQGDWLTTTPP